MSMSEESKGLARIIESAKNSAFVGYFSAMLSEEMLAETNLFDASVSLFFIAQGLKGLMSVYQFFKAKNKNLSGVSKLLVNLGLGGAALSILGVFIFAPYIGWAALPFVIYSINLIFAIDVVTSLLGGVYNLTQAFLAPANSIERKHFFQAAIKNVNSAMIAASVLTLIVAPFAPEIMGILTVGFIAYMGVNIVWHALPPLRYFIKQLLHLEKPKVDMSFTKSPLQALGQRQEKSRDDADKAIEQRHHQSLFRGCAYRKKVVVDYLKAFRPKSATAYLKDELDTKIESYKALPVLNKKQAAKLSVLEGAKALLDTENASSKDLEALIEDSDKRIYQSFFAEKADTVDLLEAVKAYLANNHSDRAISEHLERNSSSDNLVA